MNIRKMTVAGQFYNGNSNVLEKEIKEFLTGFKSVLPANSLVRSIIVPHAGYAYSGKTAAITMNEASGNKYKCIIVIAPSHYVGFSGIALPSYAYCETPFGNIKVERALVPQISSVFFVNEERAHMQEHSLEVQLPLIKHIFPETPVFPMVCGHLTSNMYEDLIKDLSKLFNEDILWVTSSDFTHFGKAFGYMPFTEHILSFDPNGFQSYLQKTEATICGATPITVMLETLNKTILSKTKINSKLIQYTTSGDLTGDYSHCVSYAGMAFYR
jgi:AmmeMemoRadiSam system protein B